MYKFLKECEKCGVNVKDALWAIQSARESYRLGLKSDDWYARRGFSVEVQNWIFDLIHK